MEERRDAGPHADSGKDADAAASRARQVIDQIMRDATDRERAIFSAGTFGEEPILRTGADLRRDREAAGSGTGSLASAPAAGALGREERAALRRQARSDVPPRPHPTARGGAARTHAQPSQTQQLPAWLEALDTPMDEPDDPYLDSWGWPSPSQGSRKKAARKVDHLPKTLRDLRSLESQTGPDGNRLTGIPLFVRQAQLAADYEDDTPATRVTPRIRYVVSYRDLSNRELADYFRWRTEWRRGKADRLPYTYGRILAAELVNGVGVTPGEACLAQLKRLYQRSVELGADGFDPGIALDARRWVRDYAILHDLPPELAEPQAERDFAQAVATLRTAERAVLCEVGARGLTTADMPKEVPSDAELWQAMGAVSTYNVERSPFLRSHPDSAAAVGAEVFRSLARHCGKRRKTNFVDGLVGWESRVGWYPLPDLPYRAPRELPVRTYHIDACTSVTSRAGRLFINRGYERTSKSRDLGRILRAMDRQMRLDWGDGRALKSRPLPKYLERFIVQASAAQHEREAEAERRKITIDLSKLQGIRTAAATTREALLVDEEIEDEPQAASAPAATTKPVRPQVAAIEPEATPFSPAATSTGEKSEAPSPQAKSPAEGGAPCDLTELELEVLRHIAAGQDFQGLLGPGKPMASVLVDSINEKLFDELGDTAIEYADGTPRLVPDYVDDVRDLCDL